MAQFAVRDLINRARTYVDDDHRDQKSWITDERWLDIMNAEYAVLYKRWLRNGLVTPPIEQAYITGDTQVIPDVLAIVGVGRDNGSSIEMLTPAQPALGRDPYWRSAGDGSSASTSWIAYGNGDVVTVELDPVPSDNTGTNYIVRYVPTPAALTYPLEVPLELPMYVVPDGYVELPFGADERLVLGVARRAHLKDSAASKLLNELIFEADAELNFAASAKVNGPRVRNVNNPFSTPNQSSWRFF